jgi:ABC-2 type transport system ATP-binding protein
LIIAGDVEQVTHQLDGSRQIEIHILDADHVAEALEVLQTIPQLHVLSKSDETTIQANFSGDDQALHQILVELITRNVPVVSFAPRSGGGLLEEVFLRITERGNQS